MSTQILQGVPVEYFLYLSLTLFSIGIFGVLSRKNAIIIFMSIELMLNAVNILLVTFATMHGDTNGQVFVFFTMAVAAAEVAVGLAILVTLFRTFKDVNIELINKLKG
jgi:NADH-quinone oxidoreductase subunit K